MRNHLAKGILLAIALLVSCVEQTKTKMETPEIVAIYPSSDTLPSNLLRMYIQFSRPMKTTGNLEHIMLIDDQGKEVKNALFNNSQELWNREQTQLTLLFDPGRVKSGLYANELFGRALVEGAFFTLNIDALEDTKGERMEHAIVKKFFVGKVDTLSPNPSQWKVIAPAPESKEPLILRFPGMLDHLSLLQRVQITDSTGKKVEGKVRIENGEREWHFIPEQEWKSACYPIYVHHLLEDPVGNNIRSTFERKRSQAMSSKEVDFEVILLDLRHDLGSN
jgi:hypothetical protein